ncbi:MAG: ATP-binding protein [Actinomycetota bacterium]
MITRIVLENWRAYRNLDIEAGPGTTFLVAPNGVGKSSLLEAVRWALAAAHVQPRPAMVRQGHDRASVEVTLATAKGPLAVRRSLRSKGARLTTEVSATLAGLPVSEERAMSILEGAWSADARFVSRTAFLTEDLRRDSESPNLRSHLCRAYSLDDLEAAMAEIEPALAQVSRGLRSSRAELSATRAELGAAEAAVVERAAATAAARAEADGARAAHSEARATLDQALAAAGHPEAAEQWRQREAELRARAAPLLAGVSADQPLTAALASLEASLVTGLDAVRERQASLAARLEAAESALAALHEAGANCPVCLRELDGESRGHAEQSHRAVLEGVRADLESVAATPAAEALATVRELAREAAGLGPPPSAGGPVAGPVVEAEALARAALEAAVVTLREAELAEQAAAGRAAEVRSELEAEQALAGQYRAEALLTAARDALEATITTVLTRQLAPVAAEVNRRWEAVFPDRPNLHVLPDGQISRDLDGTPLEFGAFSAGEQTVAKLMMRLTTLLTTTTVPFCWVDEPLEHLDPVSRRLVASTLAHLSAPGGLEQIFVTTYEEPLARRLAELQPARARVQYLRTA